MGTHAPQPAAPSSQLAAPPPPSTVAAAPPPGGDPVGAIVRRVTIAGLDASTFLRWDFQEHHEGNSRRYECVLTGADGTRFGTARAHSKKAAKAAAAQLALEHIDSNAPSLLSPPRRSGPPAQDARGDSASRCAAGLMESQRYILEEILFERNVGYQLKVAQLMVRTGRPDEELVALAQHAHALSLQGGHSAGRRFHDELKRMWKRLTAAIYILRASIWGRSRC